MARRRSLVLVVEDTLRRDALGVQGGTAATPAFDAFAREHLHFTRASAQAPWTRPSVATLFTGLYPSQHGMQSDPNQPRQSLGRPQTRLSALSPDLTTLAEVLRGAGYRTAGFVSNASIQRPFGYDQGFEVFDDSHAGEDHAGEALTDDALAWLEANERQPFFLYVHYMESHSPYGRLHPADLRRASHAPRVAGTMTEHHRELMAQTLRLDDGRSLEQAGIELRPALLRIAYRRGVENADRQLGRLLAALESPADPELAVIVTSDHGEALLERGWAGHGKSLFEDEIAVPLAAKLPGVQAEGAVECPVGLVDLMPTLCAYLGLACPGPLPGASWLRGPGEDAPPARFLVSEGVVGKPGHRAIRNQRYKLIAEPGGGRASGVVGERFALFDLREDPRERRDLMVGERAPEVERVFRILSERIATAVPPYEVPEASYAPLDAATRERLQALGYIDPD